MKYENKNGWETADESLKNDIFSYCEGYADFLDNCKTERECAQETEKILALNGFKELSALTSLKAGDRIYKINRNKGVFAAVIGKNPLSAGTNIVGAHIDAPRLDLKQVPLYEDKSLALFKTHYYGGIKKYQWVATPLAIHGTVALLNGKTINISVGEKEGDPVFCITDLLPHLADKQMLGPAKDALKGEGLNVLIGSIPLKDEEGEAVKANILKILNDSYGICEEDFISAEIEVVPAGKAKDIGFDRSLIGAYGQDDRVCAYTALSAILETKAPEKTAVCLLVDKEEIGSMGNTGMKSRFFEHIIEEMCEITGDKPYKVLDNSKCLSADVGAAVDPNFPDVHDAKNAPYLNCGTLVTKYTGSRGKSGSSDASAEFIGEIRSLLNSNNIVWQTGELGKVDEGGGGTIAQYVANLNIDVLDLGVPLLSMHSPFEISSKLDVYMTYKTYLAFFNN